MIDLLLVMTVNPGYSRQTFLPETTSKVAALRRMLDAIGSSAWLEVDGGISAQTLPEVRKAGANAFVAAQAVFDYPEGIAAGIAALRKQMA